MTQNADGEYQTLLGLPEDEGGYAGDPILGVVKQIDLGPFQQAGQTYVGLLAATILFIATNAALIGVSRLVYSMGIHRQLPDALRRLHPRFRTPWIGILVFGGAAIVTLLPGKAEFLGNMYAFGAMLSFTIAHVSVIRLRRTQPDLHRPYRGPWNVHVRGLDLPMFAVLGGLGTSIAFVVTVALHPTVAAAGFGWLVFGVLVYIAFRRRHGLDLVSTHQGRDPAAGGRPRGGVRLGARPDRGRQLRRARDGDGEPAGRAAPARDPRARARHRAQRAADRRDDDRGRGRRPTR